MALGKGRSKPVSKIKSGEGWVKYVHRQDGVGKGKDGTVHRMVIVDKSADIASRERGIGEWYSLGFDLAEDDIPTKGMYLTFEYAVNGEYKNVDITSLELDEKKSIETAAESNGSGAKGSSGGGYNENGAAWGNCLTNATQLVIAGLAHEILPKVKPKKEQDAVELLAELVQDMRLRLWANKDIPEDSEEVDSEDQTEDDDLED